MLSPIHPSVRPASHPSDPPRHPCVVCANLSLPALVAWCWKEGSGLTRCVHPAGRTVRPSGRGAFRLKRVCKKYPEGEPVSFHPHWGRSQKDRE